MSPFGHRHTARIVSNLHYTMKWGRRSMVGQKIPGRILFTVEAHIFVSKRIHHPDSDRMRMRVRV